MVDKDAEIERLRTLLVGLRQAADKLVRCFGDPEDDQEFDIPEEAVETLREVIEAAKGVEGYDDLAHDGQREADLYQDEDDSQEKY